QSPIGDLVMHLINALSFASACISTIILTSSCGSKSSPQATAAATVSSDAVSNSGSLSIDSTTDALSEGSTAGTSGLVDSPGGQSDLTNADSDITITKTCTANLPSAGNVQVLWTRSGSGSVTKTFARATLVSTLSGSGTETRSWSAPTGKTLACNSASSGVRVNWSDDTVVKGLVLKADVSRTHKMSHVWTRTKTGVSTTLVHENTTTGTRTVTWETPTVGTASGTVTITMTKSVVLDHKTSVTRTPKDGGTATTVSAKVITDSTAPLSVTVVRSGTSAATSTIQSKTVKSGTVVSTDDTSGYITKSKFADVKYDLSSTNTTKCIPVSGTISGEVYESATATTALKKYIITFGVTDSSTDSGITIAYDGTPAEEYTYSYQACDLGREG
ncbi:MAG: hypothetical protein NTV34_08355, partial [Proteobacteria bacterium]|nr:hypothetical protein [Pseudomonadota bacterium]